MYQSGTLVRNHFKIKNTFCAFIYIIYTYIHVNMCSYTNKTLLGNWSEERLKEEYEFKIFLRKRERKELLLQRSRTLFSTLLKERDMAMSGNYVMFGYNVQIVAADMPPHFKNKGLALSSLVTAREVDYFQNICNGCVLTLSPITTPCSRNVFVILSTDPNKGHGTKMNYGDQFYLQAENYAEPKAPPLYVRYNREAVPSDPDRMPLRLSNVRDTNCRFTALPLDRREDLELLGNPVKTNSRLLVKNCVADLCLSAMNQNWIQTFFGPECGVTCRDYINIHKKYCAENSFMIVSDVQKKKRQD